MSEFTELILDGILCRYCGVFVNDEIVGHPVACEDCEKEERTE